MADRARLPTIGPLLWYRDPHAAIAWLEKAFGFECRLVVEGDSGSVMHSELTLGDGYVMVVGPPMGNGASPEALDGHSTASVHIQLGDGIEAHFGRARAAGAVVTRELGVQPYGDAVYTCADPEGHSWSVGQTVKAMSTAEMEAATGHRIEVKA
ncbi:MAG: VOC family protein [Phenylobacterium sp.]